MSRPIDRAHTHASAALEALRQAEAQGTSLDWEERLAGFDLSAALERLLRAAHRRRATEEPAPAAAPSA